MIFFDTETCGLHGQMVLLQWAEDDGPIHLFEVWKQPIHKTLALIEFICEREVCGFNLVFDWFHLAKTYTIFSLFPKDWIPEEHIEEIAARESEGCFGPGLKPKAACDLLLHSRRGPYQKLMSRKDVRIRRVPTPLAYAMAMELEGRVKFDDILFARTKDKSGPRWKVFDVTDRKTGLVDPCLKDVVLKFNPAGGLKFLAEYALGKKPKAHFSDIELPKTDRPAELGYAPYASAVSSPEKDWAVYKPDGSLRGYAWPAKIQKHIDHWHTHEGAREYATDDVVYTRELYYHFESPPAGDTDSELACMVAVVRWRGFKINIPGIRKLMTNAASVLSHSPVNINKPSAVRKYIREKMTDTEAIPLDNSTKKKVLTEIAQMKCDEGDGCPMCFASGITMEGDPCPRCDGKGFMQGGPSPAAIRAQEILDVKIAAKEVELYAKLLKAGRFHASFKVIGTLSSRMSGGDGLNAQGIKHDKAVRKMFPLTEGDNVLCGGDFDAFEVTIADAVFKDPKLHQVLLEGRKIHAMFAMEIFPGTTYEEVLESDGTKNDMYGPGKSAIFAMLYGGDHNTLYQNQGIPLDIGEEAFKGFDKRFPGVKAARERVQQAFCALTQPKGIGTRVVWKDPSDHCETFLGFRRYFTLENSVISALFKLAQSVPKQWRDVKMNVVRNEVRGPQTAGGAASSALYGAAFQIQAQNTRAAANHLIQSPGAMITKEVQRAIWDLQPVGIHELMVAPMNIHDEVMCVTHPTYVDPVAAVVRRVTESYRDKVTLLGMTWNKVQANWAEKKGGSETDLIRPIALMPTYDEYLDSQAEELATEELAANGISSPKKPKGDDLADEELMGVYQRRKQEFDTAMKITKSQKLAQVKRDLTPEQDTRLREICKPEGYIPPPMEAINAT